MPHVMLDVIRACYDPALSLQELADKVNLDATLAGKVIAAAGAAIYSRFHQVTSIEDAIRVLGTDALKTIVITLSMQQVFNRFTNVPPDCLQNFWRRSLTAALFAKSFATITSYPHPEEAYLAGLIHNIGELVLGVHYGEQYFRLKSLCQHELEQVALERTELGTDHAVAGAWLTDIWKFAPHMVDAVRYHHCSAQQVMDAHHLTKLVHLASTLTLADDIQEDALLTADLLFGLMPPLVLEIAKRIRGEVDELAGRLQIQQEGSAKRKQQELADEVQIASLLQMARVHLMDASVVPDIWHRVKQAAQMLFHSPQSLLFLADNGEDYLSCRPMAQQPGFELRITLLPERSRISDAILQETVTHWWPEPGQEPDPVVERQVLTLLQTPGFSCIPIRLDEQRQGVLVLGQHQPPDPNRDRLLRLFGTEVARTWARQQELVQTSEVQEPVPSDLQHSIREAVHEANNPLTIIRNYLAVLARKLDQGHEVQQDLDIIREEVDRTAHILLNLAHSSQSRTSPPPGAVQVNQLMQQMVRLFTNSLFNVKSIQCHLACDPEIPLIETDGAALRQALTNLLKNAAEALPAGGEILIATRDGINLNGQPFIEIRICDNGPGIPAEILEHLYEPGHSTKGSGHGGLGLSIVRNLMYCLGGSVSCQSSDQGTEFRLLIPRKLAVSQGATG